MHYKSNDNLVYMYLCTKTIKLLLNVHFLKVDIQCTCSTITSHDYRCYINLQFILSRSTVVLLKQGWARFKMATCTSGIEVAPRKTKWRSTKSLQTTCTSFPILLLNLQKKFSHPLTRSRKLNLKIHFVRLSSFFSQPVYMEILNRLLIDL